MKTFFSSESAQATSARASAMPARCSSASTVPSPWMTGSPAWSAAATDSAFTSTTTQVCPDATTSSATERPTRPKPQMITWSWSVSMVRLFFRSAYAPPTTPRAIISTTAPAM